MLQKIKSLVLPVIGALFVLGVWYVLTDALSVIDELTLSGPTEVITNIFELNELLLTNFWPTMGAIAFGFLAALVLSFIIAVTLLWNQELQDGLMPLIVGINSVPRITLAPLIIFYIGGVEARYIVATWVAFFPMYMNIYSGLQDLDQNEVDLLRSLDSTYLQEMRHVRIPNAMPFIFDGMKVGIVFASVGAVVAEFVGAGDGTGLGYLALFALNAHNIGLAFSIVGIMGVFSASAFFIFLIIQDRVVYWEDSNVFPE